MTQSIARLAIARLTLALAAALTSLSALAADAPTTRAPAIQALVDCRRIEDAAGRLACYDRSVDAMAKAETAGDLVTIDRAQRQALKRQAFGFNLPTLSLLDRGKTSAEEDRITVKVASVSHGDNGRWVVRLDDGAVWEQTDDSVVAFDPHPGSTAIVRRGSLGSFFMDFDGKAGFRAARRG